MRPEGPIPILKVKCSNCCSINSIRPAESHRTGKRGSATLDITSRTGLAALHTGISHSQYSGLMSALGLPSLTLRNFKKAGGAIESVAKRSCAAFTEMERDLSANDGQGEGPVAVGVSYDMRWRKCGKSYDSSSGVGTAVGLKTGEVISYATRNTLCRVCQEAVANNREPTVHDCHRNHEGSSKSIEANVAVQLFGNAVEGGIVTRRMLVMTIAQ